MGAAPASSRLSPYRSPPPRVLIELKSDPDHSIHVEVAGVRVGAGCERAGDGPAVAASAGAYDFDALSACLGRLRQRLPSLADEKRVSVFPTPRAFGERLRIQDAVSFTPEGAPLFDEVDWRMLGPRGQE